jgi:hypothetical protein
MHAMGTAASAGAARRSAAPKPPTRAAAAPRRASVRVLARRGGGPSPFGGRGGMPGMGPPGGGGGAATAWDPENLLGAPKEGLIQRRMMAKQMEKDQEFAAAVSATKDDIRRQVLLRRSQRSPPDEPSELVEYFLNSDAEDMEYEVARCRWVPGTLCGEAGVLCVCVHSCMCVRMCAYVCVRGGCACASTRMLHARARMRMTMPWTLRGLGSEYAAAARAIPCFARPAPPAPKASTAARLQGCPQAEGCLQHHRRPNTDPAPSVKVCQHRSR